VYRQLVRSILIFFFVGSAGSAWATDESTSANNASSEKVGSPMTAKANALAPAEAPAQLKHAIPSLSEASGDQSVVKLNLEESIATAIQAATSVQKAKNDSELNGTQLVQSYAQFLPNLAATGSYNSAQGQQLFTSSVPTLVSGRTTGAAYQISSTLNIFNGFADISGLQSSLARNQSSELTLVRAKQLIALDVTQSYLQVNLDKQIVNIAERNLESSRAREQLLTEQTRVGAKNLADLYRQQAQTSSDESFLITSLDKQRNDEILLVRKLRMDSSRRYEFADTAIDENATGPLANENERQLIDTALDRRPDLAAQNQITRAFKFDLRSARASYMPKLDFVASLAAAGRTLNAQDVNGVDATTTPYQSYSDQLNHDKIWTVGLTLTWNIFDRWSTKLNVERAHVAAKNALLDNEDLHNQVVGEVRQAYGDYHAVLHQLDTSRKGLLAAQKAYETVDGRYKAGAASFIDLLTSQATLVQADAARAQSLISFALQNKVLETVTGMAEIK